MKGWMKSDIAVLLKRLAVVYLACIICQVIFYYYNFDLLGSIYRRELRGIFQGALVFDTVSVLWINAPLILLSLLPLRLRERHWYQNTLLGIFYAAGAALILLNFADMVFFHQTNKRLTYEVLAGSDLKHAFDLVVAFGKKNWYMLALAGVLIIGLVSLGRISAGRRGEDLRFGVPKTPVKSPLNYLLVNTAILVAALGLTWVGIDSGFSSHRPLKMSDAISYTASPQKANIVLSNPFCIIRTWGKQAERVERYFEKVELDEIFTPDHYPNAAFGSQLGFRNIVILVLNGWSAGCSALFSPDEHPDGKTCTPFIDSLAREGFYLTRAYANAPDLEQALPAILGSIPSFRTSFVRMEESLAENMALSRSLRRYGYTNTLFCGRPSKSMTGFEPYAWSAGIERVYAMEEYQQAKGNKDYDGARGIWDKPYLQYVAETLPGHKTPFLTLVVNTTSSAPFTTPGQSNGDPLQSVAYADEALRGFFEECKKAYWYEKSLFVVVGCRTPGDNLPGEDSSPRGRFRIGMAFYTPDGALKGADSDAAQQLDVMPTLLGLVDYDHPYFGFGRDLLGEPHRTPMAVNYFEDEYQLIDNDLSIRFSGGKVTSACASGDKMCETDVSQDPVYREAVYKAERSLKAIIQQYYDHVERKDFIVN